MFIKVFSQLENGFVAEPRVTTQNLDQGEEEKKERSVNVKKVKDQSDGSNESHKQNKSSTRTPRASSDAALKSSRNSSTRATIYLSKGMERAQKMESLGMIAGGLAHDFNNLLEVILGFASLARLKLPQQEDVQEPVRMIEEAARRAAELAKQLLALTRQGAEPEEACDPSEPLRRILKIIRRTFDRKIRIESRIAARLPWVRGDQQRLEQAILNLAINARDAMPEGGVLSIEASRRRLGAGKAAGAAHRKPGDYVRITVKDNGVGMEPEVLRRSFDPLFTTKPEGTGLGLAMVRKAVESRAGFIEVKSKPGKGSEFLVCLPVAATHAKAVKKQSPHARSGEGTVLVVDDEPMVLNFIEKGLKQLGYTVLTAATGARACELYARHAKQICCVLLDMVMPDMSGLETYEQLRQIDPHAKIIVSSGFNRSSFSEMAPEAEFLGKPYSVESLSLAIKKAREDEQE